MRHIYANIQRLAAGQGFPRHKAETPNDYLPALAAAFPGHEADVTHITTVYNACEYGDVPTDAAELRRLHGTGAMPSALHLVPRRTPE